MAKLFETFEISTQNLDLKKYIPLFHFHSILVTIFLKLYNLGSNALTVDERSGRTV